MVEMNKNTTEIVSIFGTLQSWERQNPITLTNRNVKLIDGRTKEILSLVDAQNKGENLFLLSRFNIQKHDVILIRSPATLFSFICILACLNCGICFIPISYETETHDVIRLLNILRPAVYLTDRQGLLQVDYELARLRILSGSVGGEGHLLDGSIDLTSPCDDRLKNLKKERMKLDFDRSCMYYYDENMKTIFDCTQRCVSAIARTSILNKRKSSFWKEKIISRLNSQQILEEILPRFSLEQEYDIIFHPVTSTIKLSRQIRRLNDRKISGNHDIVKQTISFSQTGQTFLQVFDYSLQVCNNSSRLGILLNSGKIISNSAQLGAQGRLLVTGPVIFQCSLVDVSSTVNSFLLDPNGCLWFQTNDIVVVQEDGITLRSLETYLQQKSQRTWNNNIESTTEITKQLNARL